MSESQILLADGNVKLLDTLKVQLESLGLAVILAKNGDEAWAAIESEEAPPLIALVRDNLPGLSAKELCERLATSEAKSRTCVCAIVTKAENIASHLEAGAAECIAISNFENEFKCRVQALWNRQEAQGRENNYIDALEAVFIEKGMDEELQGMRSIRCGESFEESLKKAKCIDNIEEVAAEAVGMFGFEVEPSEASIDAMPGVVSWGSIILQDLSASIDILITMSPEAAREMHELIIDEEPGSDEELADSQGEVMNLVQGTLKTKLGEEGFSVITPFIPKVCFGGMGGWTPAAEPTCCLSLGEKELDAHVSFYIKQLVVMHTDPAEARIDDVLAKPVLAPSGDVMLKEGTTLTQRYINILENMFSNPGEGIEIFKRTDVTSAVLSNS